MKNDHLSAEQLQTLAMAQQNTDNAMVQHLANCVSCQEEIAAYKLLYTGIKEQTAPAFDFDLAGIVLPQVQPLTTKKTGPVVRPFLVAVFVAVSLYFFRNNFIHLVSGISSVFLVASIITCLGIIVFKVKLVYRAYEQKMKKLQFSE